MAMKLYPWKYGKIWLSESDFDTRPAIETYGEYSEDEVDVFQAFIRPGSVVVDGGACWGAHTCALSSMGAAVMAFELHPALCRYIELSLADSLLPRAIVRNAALSNQDGFSSMGWADVAKAEHIGHSKTSRGDKPIFTERLDTVLSHASRCDFIKLDIEGDEPKALRGAQCIIGKFKPVLYIEYQENQADILAAVPDFYSCWLHHPRRDRYPNFRNVFIEEPKPGPPMLLCVTQLIGEQSEFLSGSQWTLHRPMK